MTEHPSQQRRTLKFRAKRTFFRFIRPCLVCTFSSSCSPCWRSFFPW